MFYGKDNTSKNKPKVHLVMVTGLGSSIPFIGKWLFQGWTKKIINKLRWKLSVEEYNSISHSIISSDGNDAKWITKEINYIKVSEPKFIIIAGHSNGYRDGLKLAEHIGLAFNNKRKVDIFIGIDMTLAFDKDNEAIPYCVKDLIDYHASLKNLKDIRKCNLATVYTYVKLNNTGHITAGKHDEVQRCIYRSVLAGLFSSKIK